MPNPRVQCVLFDGFDPLDAVAPYEIMRAGREFLSGAIDVEFVSAEGAREVVSGASGITLRATSALDPTTPGYIVVPGASGPVDGDPDEIDSIPVLLSRFSASAATPLIRQCFHNPDITVATVCGGSLALAMAGLLEGRTATTHVLGVEMLAASGVNAVRARVVDDGDLITAGGVTSGLDLGLYLLERDFGPRVARAVEELLEYERRGTAWKNIGHAPAADHPPTKVA